MTGSACHVRERGRRGQIVTIAVGMVLCCVLGVLGWLAPVSAQEPETRVNRLIDTLLKGEPAMAAESWTLVDREHAPYDITELKESIRKLLADKNAAGQPRLAPIVRVPAEGDELPRWMIKQVLENGAMGIIVPKTETAKEALNLVEAIRYQQTNDSKYPLPRGLRSGSGPGREWGLKNPRDYERVADLWPLNPVGELVAIPIVESPEGIANVEAILDVPGITGVFVGTADLTTSFGLRDQKAPEVQAAISKVAKACIAKKRYCVIPTLGKDEPSTYVAQGFKIIMTPSVPNAFTLPPGGR